MQPRVKFCGMTREEDVRLANGLGVDFVGLVLAPTSPRCVTLEQAVSLRTVVTRAKLVGVFLDTNVNAINWAAEQIGLDLVQLHGRPDLAMCRAVCLPVIQAFHGVPPVEEIERFLDCCAYVLLDKRDGEAALDVEPVKALPRPVLDRAFVAGGFDPTNVRQALKSVRPFGVDCARGIEIRPGVKDHDKMRLFLQQLLP